ncbi:flagellar hook-length control protein FliK [Syntrophotalea acetylenica]|jgi:hypothetical protein|uniref:Flagellar hook-length control protein-like C-terminal domain-containing protein n=1 Tax=Syntrophotalea acetylenica TaxID=29542 RepID=A0A1L3GCY3_SYNAC|nr:flagellar hook-length control protein FliK [Syntrophotalea acetylenica]APG23803.1 hypothetical protein A7E75_01280 [Syntrophotalea acetylenica]APG44385.1 hypothetical protein A6070_09890 [Syntrophotalea acetylenica]
MKITDTTFTIAPVSANNRTRPSPDHQQPAWKPGQILQATVLARDGGQVLLDVQGQAVPARCALALQQGQQVLLHVTATAPQIRLQALGHNQASPTGATLQLLETGWQLPAFLRQMQNDGNAAKQRWPEVFQGALQTFMAGLETATADGTALSALLQNLGVARLRRGETSTSLMETIEQAVPADCQEDDSLAEWAAKLAQGLRMMQQFNLASETPGVTLLPLPLPFLQQGLLLIEYPVDAPREKPATPKKLSLFLDLENLGEMRVDMLLEKDDLWVRFTCQSEHASERLRACAAELKEALHLGSRREILFTTGNPRPEEKLENRCGEAIRGFVNTRI